MDVRVGELRDRGIMQSYGIRSVRGDNDVGSNLSGVGKYVSKRGERILVKLDHILGGMEVRYRVVARNARKYKCIGSAVAEENLIGGVAGGSIVSVGSIDAAFPTNGPIPV